MPTIKLTQTAVDRLKPPSDMARIEYWDSQLPGFGLRITSEGRKVWQTMYRVAGGRQRRETLGTLATMPRVDDARNAARASMLKARQGVDPVAERKAAQDNTVAALFDKYTDKYMKKKRRRDDAYIAETRRTFNADVLPALGTKLPAEVGRRDIRQILAAVEDRGSLGHANHVLAYARAFFAWCVAEDVIETNPAAGIQKPTTAGQRMRALNDDEIRIFWCATERLSGVFGPFFRMLLLTGQRRGEVAGMVWDEIDRDAAVWHIPGARTKNKRDHDVQLAPPALAILEAQQRYPSGLVFTATGRPLVGFKTAWTRLSVIMEEIAGAPIPHFMIHDLRRTASTGMARIGVEPHIISKIQNHSAGPISGVTAIYNRYSYEVERRAALEQWARHVESMVASRRGAPVVSLRRN